MTWTELMNGAKIPNWAKILGVGIALGIQGAMIFYGQTEAVAQLGRKFDEQAWFQARLVMEQQAMREDMRHAAVLDSTRLVILLNEISEMRTSRGRLVRMGNEVHLELWRAVGRPGAHREIQ